MAVQTCPACGSPNAAGDVFCAKCGTRLNEGAGPPTDRPAGLRRSEALRYAPVMVPSWLTAGLVLVIIAGVLLLAGFLVFVVGTASLGATTTLNDLKSYLEEFGVLVGVGIFLGAIGWSLHQMSVLRRRG